MPNITARFNGVSQLAERLLNKLVAGLYDSGVVPYRFTGDNPRTNAEFGITVASAYDLSVRSPELELDGAVASGIQVRLGVSGWVELRAAVDPRPISPSANHAWRAQVVGSATFRVPLTTRRTSRWGWVELDLSELADLDLEVRVTPSFGLHDELARQFAKRAILVGLRTRVRRLPLSPRFDAELLGGSAFEDLAVRIIDGPCPPDEDDVTIAVSSWPNRGRGRAADLFDTVNPRDDLVVAVHQRHLIQAFDIAWKRGVFPRKFEASGEPDASGGLTVNGLAFDLQDGALLLTIDGTREAAGGRSSSFGFTTHVRPFAAGGELRMADLSAPGALPFELRNLALRLGWLVVGPTLLQVAGFRGYTDSLTEYAQRRGPGTLPLRIGGSPEAYPLDLIANFQECTVSSDEVVVRASIRVD